MMGVLLLEEKVKVTNAGGNACLGTFFFLFFLFFFFLLFFYVAGQRTERKFKPK